MFDSVFRIHLMKAIINYFNPSIMGEIYDFNMLVFLEFLNYLPRIKYSEQSNSKSIFRPIYMCRLPSSESEL